MVEHEEYMRIEDKDGRAFVLYTDAERLEQHMKELAPEDADTIDELLKGAERAGHLDVSFMKAPEVQNVAEKVGPMLKMLPHLPFVMKWAKFPFGDYGQRFKNPFLREAFSVLAADIADMPAFGLFNNIAWYAKPTPTFSDAIAVVRSQLWRHLYFPMSHAAPDVQKIPPEILTRFTDALCYAT